MYKLCGERYVTNLHIRPTTDYSICSYSKCFQIDALVNTNKQDSEFIPTFGGQDSRLLKLFQYPWNVM